MSDKEGRPVHGDPLCSILYSSTSYRDAYGPLD